MSTKVKLWTVGIALAVIGVVMARIISSRFAGEAVFQLAIYLTGVILAIAGLVIILAGIRKK